MIRSILLSIFGVVVLMISLNSAQAQEYPKREIGIRLISLDDFGFIYKKEQRENRYFRHRLGLVRLGATGISNSTIWNIGLGYAFGIENRKAINEKFKFIHGPEPRISANYSFADNHNYSWIVQVGLGYILGFQYDLSESFYVNIEATPALTVRRNTQDDRGSTYAIHAGFDSNAVALTLAYRF